MHICKKTRQIADGKNGKFVMDGDQKKSLKIAISEFYKLNIDKGKEHTIKNFKDGSTN